MATDVVKAQTTPAASTLTDVHTVAADKLDTIRVFVSNRGAATTWRLTYAPAGAADVDAHVIVRDENLSSPGSGVSKPMTMAATDVLRVFSPSADLTIFVNGISQDV